MSLTKSRIEYLEFCWNFQTGCLHWKTDICAVANDCWAKTIALRFHKSFEPTLHPELLFDPLDHKKPAVIGVCFTGDLFGDWVDPEQIITKGMAYAELRDWILTTIRYGPKHTFLFLTKNPKGYQKWGKFPDNAWCGTTITNNYTYIGDMVRIQAKHKWLSIEPLLEWRDFPYQKENLSGALKSTGIEWVVIGAQSGRHPIQPKIEWVKEIVEACDKAGILVWLKDNLVDGFHKIGIPIPRSQQRPF